MHVYLGVWTRCVQPVWAWALPDHLSGVGACGVRRGQLRTTLVG